MILFDQFAELCKFYREFGRKFFGATLPAGNVLTRLRVRRRGRDAEGGQGDFGSAEEFRGFVAVEDFFQHSEGDAGDEVGDVLLPRERRHGVAERDGRLATGEEGAVVAFGREAAVAGSQGGKVVGAALTQWATASFFSYPEPVSEGSTEGKEFARGIGIAP